MSEYDGLLGITGTMRKTIAAAAERQRQRVAAELTAGTTENLRALRRVLAPWSCCGSPQMCDARCQDDPLSAALAAAYREVVKAVEDEPTDPGGPSK